MFELPPLPYAYDALEPWISEKTLRLHHDVLQRRYVDKLNELVGNRTTTLDAIIRTAPAGPLLDNASQVWNHTFLWDSMRPPGGAPPAGRLLQSLRSWDGFIDNVARRAAKLFGSGYIWILASRGDVGILEAANADNPLRLWPNFAPILTIDIWEHAYILDYGADRAQYVRDFLTHFVNWDFASRNYEFALTGS